MPYRSACRGRSVRVVGKEFVRTVVAFLTNDSGELEPGAGWSSSGRTFRTGQIPEDGSGSWRWATARGRSTVV